MFKIETVDEHVWMKLLSKVEGISSCERIGHDIYLIGSHARGDASPISDIDLVLYADGESNLKQMEIFSIDGKPVTIFPINVQRLLKNESIDFYNANNPLKQG